MTWQTWGGCVTVTPVGDRCVCICVTGECWCPVCVGQRPEGTPQSDILPSACHATALHSWTVLLCLPTGKWTEFIQRQQHNKYTVKYKMSCTLFKIYVTHATLKIRLELQQNIWQIWSPPANIWVNLHVDQNISHWGHFKKLNMFYYS